MKIRFFEAVFSPLFKIRYHYKNDNTVNDNTACLAKLWILLDLKLYQLIIKFWLINLTGVRKIETISSKIHQEKIMAIVRDFFSFLAQICKVWFCSTFILSFFFSLNGVQISALTDMQHDMSPHQNYQFQKSKKRIRVVLDFQK